MTTHVLLSERIVVTPREFASLFGRHYTWAYRQIYAGNIKVISKLGRMMIPSSEVDRLLKQNSTYRVQKQATNTTSIN
jgi:predicted site-specific integrase-resolvase